MSFLTFCQRDLQFQRRQQSASQAQNLARAGIEYYSYLDNKSPSRVPVNGTSLIVQVVPGQEEFELQRLATGNHFISKGRVLKSNGAVMVERAIVVPNANPAESYDRHL